MFTGFYKNFKNQFKFKLLYPNRIDTVHAFDKVNQYWGMLQYCATLYKN